MLSNKITLGAFPASQKIYVPSKKFDDVAVAMRQINLAKTSTTKDFKVYDTSGVYTDQNYLDKIDLNKGLPKIRQQWILDRDDVESYEGRNIRPEDNGKTLAKNKIVPEFDLSNKKPLRAKKNNVPTQMAYARAGMITKEMEYIAIRENIAREEDYIKNISRAKKFSGEKFGAKFPDFITAEFVRDEIASGRAMARPMKLHM
jgi:phosphomethylpyrimidine synthase